jgi:hypothetical protein
VHESLEMNYFSLARDNTIRQPTMKITHSPPFNNPHKKLLNLSWPQQN